MKKIVFSGTINGETFNNVEDYNQKISSLIRAGETNIQASSSTQIYDENENYLIFVNGILNPISKKYQPFIDFKNNILSKLFLRN